MRKGRKPKSKTKKNVLWAMGYTEEEAGKLIDTIIAGARKQFEELK